jgi:hypothetical protein
MADDRQHTVKESKGLRNRLKKAFGLGSQSTPPSRSNSPSTVVAPPVVTAMIGPDEAATLRAKYTRFRILVIGRANAGKTTLLKRVCNTIEEPSTFDKGKNLVSYRLIVASQSHRFSTNSLNRHRRYWLINFRIYVSPDD